MKQRLITVFAVVFLLWPHLAEAKPINIGNPANKKPRLFILAIGVNNYDDSFFPPLKWAEQDAARFVTEVGRDTGFEQRSVVLSGAQVSSAAIKSAIDNIASQAKLGDALIIYLSSHGSLKVGAAGELEPVIVLPDSTSSQIATSTLSHKTLLRWIGNVAARKKILVTASCHSGVGKSRLTPSVAKLLSQNKGIPDLATVSEGTMILSAAAKSEVALEDDKFQSDLYTHFFIEALTLYDRNRDGSVSVLEAHDYATELAFKASKGRQRPTIQVEAIGDMDIPLRGRSSKKAIPILEGYDSQFAGVEVEVNRQEKGRLPFAFPLKTGRNEVTLYSQDRAEKLGEYTLKAYEGQTVSIEQLLQGQPFSLGPYIARVHPSSRAYSKLTDGPLTFAGVYGVGRIDRFEFGLNLQVPIKYSAKIIDGLSSDSNEQATTISAGYRLLQRKSFVAAAHALVGQNQYSLSISDSTTGYRESIRSNATIIGGRLSIFWSPIDLILLGIDGEYQKLKHDFGRLGKIDGTRRIVQFSLRYTFGGRARRK